MPADLSALTWRPAWAHFANDDEADDEAAALDRLRATMGSSYTSSPTDEVLGLALARAVAFLHRATGRLFVATSGTLSLDPEDGDPTGRSYRLRLPLPVVSARQRDDGGVTAVSTGDVDDPDLVDADDYVVNDGLGFAPNDPRDQPWIDLRSTSSGLASPVSVSPESPVSSGWGVGVRNVHVTALWGYCDEAGRTPEQVRKLLALLTIRELADLGDDHDRGSLLAGAVIGETVEGRSVTLAAGVAGAGATGDRVIDTLIAAYRRPPQARINKPPNRVRRAERRRLY